MSTTSGRTSKMIDIECQSTLPVWVGFSCGGKEIVCGERYTQRPGGRLRRYQVSENVNQTAKLLLDTINDVTAAVVSKDGRWIVSIMGKGKKVVVRNTSNNEVVEVDALGVHAVDVSPNSTRFALGSEDKTVSIFSITTGQRVLGPLQHNTRVFGVKFSPNGERLAAATSGDLVCVWDARKGNKLLQSYETFVWGPTVNLTHCFTPLGWSSDSQRVFVVSCGRICGVDISKPDNRPSWYWKPIPASNDSTFCSLVTNGRFIACAAGGSLSFWDTSSYTQIGSAIEFHDSILSIALSHDDSYLACGRGDGKISVYALRDILPLNVILDPGSCLPFMNVSDTVFKPWIEQDFRTADEQLSREMPAQTTLEYHALANRALIRAQNLDWHIAIRDANESLTIQPSVIGHVAKALALLGKGERDSAIEAFDVAFRDCLADEIRFLLLIKAIFLFVSGKREYGIARVNDLIAVADDSAMYDCLQVLANMHLSRGQSALAMQSFERAQSLSFSRRGFHLVTILLIFGRSFEELEIIVRRPLRGATV